MVRLYSLLYNYKFISFLSNKYEICIFIGDYIINSILVNNFSICLV